MTLLCPPISDDSALSRRPTAHAAARVPEEGLPTVVTICCPSYSGSTLLDLMLGHGDDGFSCGEIGFWYRPIERRHRTMACSCGRLNCSVWRPLLDAPEAEFHRTCLQTRQTRFVIDSTKRLSWALDVHRWARRRETRVTNLVVWKSLELYAYSWWKRGKPIAGAIERYLRYFSQLRETRLPVLAVNYERLVANPSEQLRDLCDLLGMQYFPGKERFWEQTAHVAFGNSGTRGCLQSPAPEIRSQEELPAEYRRELARTITTTQQARADEILLWLERHDVTFADPDRVYDVSTPLRRPVWYFQQRLAQQVRAWARWHR